MQHNGRRARWSRLRLVLSTWLIAGLAGCAGAGPRPAPTPTAAPPAAQVTPVSATVRAGSIFALTDSPLFMALERGYFQEMGITLELQQFDTIVNMIPLVSTGQLDVAFDGASSAGFFNAIARGIEIKMVANQGIASGSATEDRTYYGLVASKSLVDSGQVRSAADR